MRHFQTLLWGLALSVTTQAQGDPNEGRLEIATFAGGCFWCVEHAFDEIKGVTETISGYIGGHKRNPTYKQVSSGKTGHAEAVQLRYDPDVVSYADLLQVFWHNIDPVTPNAQFCDIGSQYRSAIFYHNEEQKRLAEQSLAALKESGALPKPIVTEITAATEFYAAEEYHQDYHHKNPIRYKFYRYNCGRDQRLMDLWGDLEER